MTDHAWVEALRRHCLDGSSGTFFAVMPDGRQARIGLVRGHIVHLALHTLRAQTAIKALANRAPKAYHFVNGLSPEPQPDLPATQVILDSLLGANLTPQAFGSGPGTIHEDVLAMVSEELAEFLGPIAPLLVEEQRAAPSLDALLKKLTAQLDGVADAEKFLARVHKRLNS